MAINNYYHIASGGGGDFSGDSWANAMRLSDFETHLETAVVAGDVYFVKEGTFVFGSDINFISRNGTALSPIAIYGVKFETTNEGSNVIKTDFTIDDLDKPYFDQGNYQFITGDYCVVKYMKCIGEDVRVLDLDFYSIIEDCIVENDHVGSSEFYYSVDAGDYSSILHCDIKSTNRGVIVNDYVLIGYNYFHDISDASQGHACFMGGFGAEFIFNTFDTCTTAILSVAKSGVSVISNTFYDCDTVISETTGSAWKCISNILQGSSVAGFSWGTQTDINSFCNNLTYNCTLPFDNVDTTTIYQDYNVKTTDPLFTDAPNGDFSLSSKTSPAYNSALGVRNSGS